MGGSWSQQAALRGGKLIKGSVIYYGMPETDSVKLSKLNAKVLGIFGNKDKWITPKIVADYKEAMKKAGKRATIYSYDADHGFANPSNPNHNTEATNEAHRHMIFFFKRELELF